MERILFNSGWAFKKQSDSHEFNLKWEEVILPHDAVISTLRNPDSFNGTKKAFFENGAYEYVKIFSAPAIWKKKHVYLEFQGVQNHAFVYVNGRYAGKHAYGYTEFTLEITKLLNFETDNVIKVICKTCDDSRWYTGAGIYRDVNLLIGESLHILNNGIKISTVTADERSAVINVNTLTTERYNDAKIKTQIFFDGKLLSEKSSQDSIETFTIIKPQLWSAENPKLYTCYVTLLQGDKICDTAETQFGIRILSVDAKKGFLVNGKEVKLRGACIHHDNGVIGVRTFRDAEYRRVQLLKTAGFNALRMAHNPASRALLDACDELGMYVMDESFDIWQLPKSADDYANDFDENYKNDLRAMVDKDFNHPSVVMYSIGNEIGDLANSTGVALAKKLSKTTKKLDPTRFTTVAINGLLLLMQKMELAAVLKGENGNQRDVNENLTSLDDAMESINSSETMDKTIQGGCDSVDIAGYNYMHHRYARDMEKYPDRVIVGSETYLKYIPEMWEHITAHHNVIGDFTWTGWDYLGETGIGLTSYEKRDYHNGFYGVYPCITAFCGDIDITGFRLPQSYYREIVYGLRKEPYIAVHNPVMAGKEEYLSTWGWGDVVSSWDFHGYEGVPLTIDVYSTEETELFLNGQSVGKSIPERFKCNFTIPFTCGTLEAVCKSGKYTLLSGGTETKIAISCEKGISGELIFAEISLTDARGVVRYGKDRLIKLNVEGGILLGFGSGAPQTEESYADNVHTTWNGRAFAVILVKKNKITLTATADSIVSQKIVLEI